jgi:hypothetical protein
MNSGYGKSIMKTIETETKIFNCKEKLEVYKLTNGEYILQPRNPVWLPEIGLGIGKEIGTYQGITREWLYWFDETGKRFLTPEERILQSEEKAHKLTEILKKLGVDPENL